MACTCGNPFNKVYVLERVGFLLQEDEERVERSLQEEDTHQKACRERERKIADYRNVNAFTTLLGRKRLPTRREAIDALNLAPVWRTQEPDTLSSAKTSRLERIRVTLLHSDGDVVYLTPKDVDALQLENLPARWRPGLS
jgi:hypothetical protein